MKKKYMNPYMAGTILGIVLLLAMFLAGRGLGASGGLKYCVVSIVGAVDRPHADGSIYYSKYFEDGKKPLKNWLTIEIFGVVAGGFFFVYGAQLARGCTSGAALSGMAVLSVAGFVTMVAIFGSAYLFAWFFRKNWI